MKGRLYFMAGAALGAAVTYLYCAQDNPELEDRLQRKAEDLATKAERTAEDVERWATRKLQKLK